LRKTASWPEFATHRRSLLILARYRSDEVQWVLDACVKTWLAPDFSGWTL